MILKGFISDVGYSPQFAPSLMAVYPLANFDINTTKHFGFVNLGMPENSLAFSRWISPKRTRSYPFARIFDTFQVSNHKITIIPIIKDEGADSGNNDRINFMTFSWMSLLNVNIILAWYERASRKSGDKELITNQRLNTEHVRETIEKLGSYHLSALHWNTTHFQEDFEHIFLKAVESYQRISVETSTKLHSANDHLRVLQRYMRDGKFDLQAFKEDSLPRSRSAANRESQTSHKFESLSEGSKNLIYISNYLGGEYYLSPDEVYFEDDILVIQESKNSTITTKLPSRDDIKDGLFKLILYGNLKQLYLDGQEIAFRVRLKITGGFAGRLLLPENETSVTSFCTQNRFTRQQTSLVIGLNKEASTNPRLSVLLSGRG
jgi:hypothetical protein